MPDVLLSRSNLIGNYFTFWDSVEFPTCLFISLESSPGYGEGGGGAGVGEVVNALSDMESGCFVKLARLDELVENFPKRDEVETVIGPSATMDDRNGERRQALKKYLSTYPWKFVNQINGSTIEWKN